MSVKNSSPATSAALLEKTPVVESKFMLFRIGIETFGVDIRTVREIIQTARVTQVPTTPNFVKGVFNLRGKIIPLIDLSLKFNMKRSNDSTINCVLVGQSYCSTGELTVGIMLDSVKEVLTCSSDEIQPAPSFGDLVMNPEFILGMVRRPDGVVTLLDFQKVIAACKL